MKLQKRLLALLMAVLMMVSLFPLQTFAADGDDVKPETEASESAEPETEPAESTEPETGGAEIILSGDCGKDGAPVTYTLTADGVLTISGSGAMEDYSSESGAPWYRKGITRLVIEEGVTAIGSYSLCSLSVPEVTLPSTVESIGYYAFKYLSTSSLNLGNVVTIGSNAFYQCRLSCDIVLPNTVTSVGQYAFFQGTCSGKLVISDSMTEISRSSFSTSNSFTSIVFGAAIRSIDNFAISHDMVKEVTYRNPNSSAMLSMYRVTTLERIYIPEGSASRYVSRGSIAIPNGTRIMAYNPTKDFDIQNGVLELYNGDDSEIVIPEGVTAINAYAFQGCKTLKTVHFPSTLQSIGNNAFSGCSGLQGTLSLPDGLQEIGSYAFYGCSGLSGDLLLPQTVTSIGSYAFYGCSGLNGTLSLPAGLTKIEDSTFYNCSGLQGMVIIPERVTSIGSYAFNGCNGITGFDFGSSLETLGQYSINCSAVREIIFRGVTVPPSLKQSGMSGLTNQKNLEKVSVPRGAFIEYSEALNGQIPADARIFCLGFEGTLLTEDHVLLGYYGDAAEVTIPEDVVSICSGAFRNCTNLVSVTIPENVTAIGAYAFYNCTSLETAVIPENLESLGSYAFYNCAQLSGKAVIPSESTEVPECAYYNCSHLTSMSAIPDSVTKIRKNAFYNCSSIAGSLSLPAALTELGEGCFYGCSGLTGELVIPGGVEIVSIDAFNGCSGIDSLVVSDGVVRLKDRAFYGMGMLSSATFGSTVVEIMRSATAKLTFGNTDCETVTINANTIGAQALYGMTDFKSLKTLYVPQEAYSYYVTNWRKYLRESIRLLPIGENGDFVVQDGLLTAYQGEGGDIVLPDTVTEIGASVFLNNTAITSVWMPDTVKSIGDNAFSGCSALQSVHFSQNLETIGKKAFYQCKVLEEAPLPQSLQVISESAFENCNKLTGAALPAGLKTIGSRAFYGCYKLTEALIPDSVTSIGSYAFYGCYTLNTLQIPDHITVINDYTFYNCSSLKTIHLPLSLKTIGVGAFQGCSGLTSLQFPDGLTQIKYYAFRYCSGLSGKICFPAQMTEIGVLAFEGCSGLDEIEFFGSPTVGKSSSNTNYCTFKGCTNLKKATFHAETPPEYYYLYDQKLPEMDVPSAYYAAYAEAYATALHAQGRMYCLDDSDEFVIQNGTMIAYQGNDSSVVIPAEVTKIGTGAFANNTSLQTVEIPEGVTSIGDYAFCYCSNLQEINIPDSVTELGKYAFYYCQNLLSAHLSDGIKTIGAFAFGNCRKLSDLVLPAELETIETYGFYYCSALSSLVLPETLRVLGQAAFNSCPVKGYLKVPDGVAELTDNCLPGSITDLVLGSGITALSSASIPAAERVTFTAAPPTGVYAALSNHTKLNAVVVPEEYFSQYQTLLTGLTKKDGTPVRLLAYGTEKDFLEENGVLIAYLGNDTVVTVPEGVTAIGPSAFQGCSAITFVTLPDTVTAIGINAFFGCTSLERINFPSELEEIADNAFKGCKKLGPTLVLQEGLKSVGAYAFADCIALTSVLLPNTVESIGNYAFSGCTGMSGDFVLPSSITSLGTYVFNGCNALSGSLTLPESLRTLKSNTFYNTKFTGALLIPDSVETIENYAFYGNAGITSITFGSGLKSLGTAFYSCTGITELTFTGTTVPTLNGNPFSSMTKLETVYVPVEAYDDYVMLLTGKIGSNVQISTDMTRLAVTNLRAERVGSASASLKWDAHVSGEAERYTILRDGQVLSETDGLTFRDSGLTPGQTYTYEVYGVLPGGGQTGVSKPVTVTPQTMTITDIRTGNAQNKVGLEHGNIMAYVSDPVGASVTAQGMLYYLDGETPVEIGPMPRSAELSSTSTAVFLAAWDIENVPDGDYTVRFVLTDEDGTAVQRDQVVTVDHTRPAQIAGLAATDDVTAIHLTWLIAAELDTTAYRIYRRVQGSEEFRMIGQVNDRDTLSYVDRNVRNDRVYEYYVTGVSSFGQESLPSLVVTATLIADTTAPTVTKLTPDSMSWLTGSVTIAMKAEDDVAVSRTELLYSADGGETWEAFAFARAAMLTGTLNTGDLPDGEIRVRALAWDAAGNESDPLTYVYRIDNTGPEAVTGLAAEATSVTITLRWNDVADDDISFFRVERLNGDGSYVKQADSYRTLGLNITGLEPDTDYTYRVVGYDVRGNRGAESEPITVRTAADTTAPVITRILPASGYYNAEIPLSITAEDDYNVVSFTVQVSTDGLTWSDVDSVSFDGVSSRRTLTYALSLADLPEGIVSVRAVAADSAGNHSDSSAAAPLTQHMVDRTPPAAPANVMATGGVGYVEVSWVQGSESDLGKYSVYRSDAEDGEYVRVASGITSVNWFDRTPEENTTYYYKVTVNDLAGNESALSEAVSAQAENDTEPPKIVSVYPEQGSALGAGYRTVSVLASDNRSLNSILVEYSADGETWSKAGELKNINAFSKRYAPQLPLSALEDGKTVYVRAAVTDLSGNTVTGSAQHYVADLTAPTVRTASAVFDQAEDEVTVTWTGAQETDLAGYRVYRSVVGASGEKLIAQRKAVEGQTEYTCKDVDISAQAVQYVYRVEAMDSCGNTASLDADVLTIPDRTAPKAVLECDPVQEVGVEYLFDATKSRDNGSIVSYQMDLGDGTVTDQPKLVHVYQETGEYTVTLTVADNEGNVSTLTQNITVRERNLMGEAQILVLDDAGKPVPNAPVYFDLGEETQVIRNTDQNGAVLFMSGVGRHTVGCVIANNEWLPAKKDVIISANARAVVSITLVRQPMIEGEFEVKRMTFDEIVAHGIDISAPENQHMLQVRSTLTYGSQTISTTFVYNELTQETLAPPFVITTEDGVKHTLLPKVIPIPGAMVDEATFTSEAAVAYLDIPASASFLKEFFDVKLHIINNAASTFVMLDNTVTLNVPNGLSIVPSEATESNSVVMIPEIPGQTTSTISWILRGDRAGEYPLSADYSGKLSEFDKTIAAHFEARDPIKVYGLDAVKLIAEVNTSLDYDALYFGLSMQNVGEAEIYLPDIGVMKDTISSQLNEDAANAVTVRALNTVVTNASGARRELRAGAAVPSLRPGETLTRQYAAYGAVGENHVLQLRDIIAQIAESYGMSFEIIERKADLFSMDHAAEKLSSIAADENRSGEYNYILNHANFFYVQQALTNDEELVNAVSTGQYQSAELHLDYVLSRSEQTSYAVQELVLRLLRDEALAQTAETRVAGHWLGAADALSGSLRENTAQTLSEADLTILNAWLADDADRGSRSEALRRDGLESFAGRTLRTLEADGMSAEGIATIRAWLESTAAADALSAALCKGSPLLTAAVERRADLSFDVASCDAILMMEAVCSEAQALPTLLSAGVTENSKQAKALDDMADALKGGTETLTARLMTALDACSDASEIAAAVSAVCGDTTVDTLIAASFDELAVPDKIFVRTMLSAETALSFALTKAISHNGGLAPKDDAAALDTLKALKYLISLRIYSEKTFADQADADESVQQPTVNHINAARNSSYETVNDYARDVSADLLRYRDDLFASGRTDPNRPEAPVVTVNYLVGTTAERFSSDYEYSFDGTHWTRCSGAAIDLAPGAVAKHLRVRLRETASAFAGNEANVVVAAKPRLQGDIQLVISDEACTVSGLAEGVYAYAFTDNREQAPSFTGRFSVDASGSVTLSYPQPFLYLALERQADETHFASLVRFAMQDNWLRDNENMFIIGIPAGTSYEDALDHYARLGLEALITDASGNLTTSVGTGSLVDLGGEVYEAVVLGDVDGDASVSQNDLDLMLDHINYQQMLDGAYLRAAQATNEEEVGIFDLYEVFDYTETHTLED